MKAGYRKRGNRYAAIIRGEGYTRQVGEARFLSLQIAQQHAQYEIWRIADLDCKRCETKGKGEK